MMKMRTLVLFISLFACQIVNSDFNLQINGPEVGQTGDLIVLSSIGSESKNRAWIVPKTLQGKTLEGCADQIAFATRVPGVYTFVLYGTDGTALLHVSHTVSITKDGGVIDPPILPPPVGNFEQLTKSSRTLSSALNEPTIRAKLFKKLNVESFGDSLPVAQEKVERLVTSVLAERTRDQQDGNWFEGWYVPMLKQMKALSEIGAIKTIEQYNEAVKAIVAGLQ